MARRGRRGQARSGRGGAGEGERTVGAATVGVGGGGNSTGEMCGESHVSGLETRGC
jgi:hypothetical protein